MGRYDEGLIKQILHHDMGWRTKRPSLSGMTRGRRMVLPDLHSAMQHFFDAQENL